MKHKKYGHARPPGTLKYSKDFKSYVDKERSGGFPETIYCGERIIYLTPGIDHLTGGGWRGNLSDDWPCIDFGFDFALALKWLFENEDGVKATLALWENKRKKNG